MLSILRFVVQLFLAGRDLFFREENLTTNQQSAVQVFVFFKFQKEQIGASGRPA